METVTPFPQWPEFTVETLRCNFCKVSHPMAVVHGRATTCCTYCGSNNLVTENGTFVGPLAKF